MSLQLKKILNYLQSLKQIKFFSSFRPNKKIYFSIAAITVTVIILEIISLILVNIFLDSSMTLSKMRSNLKSNPSPYNIENASSENILHPYLGFVVIPGHNPYAVGIYDSTYGIPANEYGFNGKENPIQKKERSKVIIGLFGGSVAINLYIFSKEVFIEELKKHAQFSDKEIVLIPLAVGGYKQPQQLIALNYMASMGAEFDIIINLDGVNDITYQYNERKNSHPSYPQRWDNVAGGVPGKVIRLLVGRITYIEGMRNSFAEIFSLPLIDYSNTFGLVWLMFDKLFERAINENTTKLHALKEESSKSGNRKDYGPPYDYSDAKKNYNELAETWQKSSLLMNVIARGMGARYFHFLQPNQYVPNSKPLTPFEKEYLTNNELYREVITNGYPLLVAKSKEFAKRNLEFYDLRWIFKNNRDDMYNDSCCHFTIEGNHILTKEVAKIVARSTKTK